MFIILHINTDRKNTYIKISYFHYHIPVCIIETKRDNMDSCLLIKIYMDFTEAIDTVVFAYNMIPKDLLRTFQVALWIEPQCKYHRIGAR